MQYAQIKGLSKEVSRIFYGTAMEPISSGAECNALFDSIYKTGVNAFDTARVYGGSESSLGKWIAARHNREDIVLLSKCAHHNVITGRSRVGEKQIRKDFETSAKCLGTDYIDIYLLHRDDPRVPVGEIVEIMNALYNEGKIRAFGGSNWSYERIREANCYAEAHGLIPFSFVSPHYGLAEQVVDPWGNNCVPLTEKAQEEARQWYRANQMPIVAYSSMARGLFSGRLKADDVANAGKYLDKFGMKGFGYPENFERLRRSEIVAEAKGCTVAQVAISWMYRQGLNMFAVISTSSAERMQSNIEAIDLELTDAECRYLNLESEAIS